MVRHRRLRLTDKNSLLLCTMPDLAWPSLDRPGQASACLAGPGLASLARPCQACPGQNKRITFVFDKQMKKNNNPQHADLCVEKICLFSELILGDSRRAERHFYCLGEVPHIAWPG